ncbi:uncharacterized protein TRIVIDRAFT_222125 [Trichoderma virens Gv29-8]|uniref:Uncharacterized protein n=1 Tax=Hypocrea virens (strain Gv29-8 / FGSC 10586) TaxID=413071 RepID=G9MRZ9_HYPVG|nr:uncharacterized protein TRIVIDRAFT_222125 [Trichoderma virens Gv29-8]EHK22867.1 hypothetical protein TRIVIDRAFT_222125 [Trichoderma virens Gv29-8]UKZ47918.1 hypothetical protein TrVGV298_002152 [Trichoderma virens]
MAEAYRRGQRQSRGHRSALAGEIVHEQINKLKKEHGATLAEIQAEVSARFVKFGGAAVVTISEVWGVLRLWTRRAPDESVQTTAHERLTGRGATRVPSLSASQRSQRRRGELAASARRDHKSPPSRKVRFMDAENRNITMTA